MSKYWLFETFKEMFYTRVWPSQDRSCWFSLLIMITRVFIRLLNKFVRFSCFMVVVNGNIMPWNVMPFCLVQCCYQRPRGNAAWKCKQKVFPKRWMISTGLLGVISQKTVLLLDTSNVWEKEEYHPRTIARECLLFLQLCFSTLEIRIGYVGE